MVCDLWLLNFDPFCVSVFQGLVLVIVITIEGSQKQLWRQLLNLTVHVCEKRYVLVLQHLLFIIYERNESV